jgi:hypothetical protein
MLRHLGGVTPRGGMPTADLPFDILLLEPAYGQQRMTEYPVAEATCQR